ncbi:hypothetical protein [Acetobacterium tundrae]|uniref:Uncharacterized protein n=1 Tax=Acetobacterium tundrae TaxID=132932 RepID=A0ABR6WMB7_9FIRM|nr:hypothetical protein [Acetobacterium tundrae]MBC3797657.1 hypothetical protein [Acetobacterium tundrae]
MNNLKIKNGDSNKPFKYEEDYYGFFPLANEQYKIKEIPDNLGKPDLIYLTDTYGVYTDEFYKKNNQGNRSGMIYGGTQEKEVSIIRNSLDNNVIIGEFNILASPTNSQVREGLENIFGIKWNNWIGRYFSDLSNKNVEIPNWMKENYAMQYGQKWDLKGAGIVLVGADDMIIVLRNGIELGGELNTINFSGNANNEFSIKNNSKYYYWFEIVNADNNAEILANYKLDVTETGQKLLDDYGLPNTFPAIVRKTGSYTSYYFAGDFADSKSTPSIYNIPGIPFLNQITTLDEDSNQNYFYWNVYYPLIEKIINNIN